MMQIGDKCKYVYPTNFHWLTTGQIGVIQWIGSNLEGIPDSEGENIVLVDFNLQEVVSLKKGSSVVGSYVEDITRSMTFPYSEFESKFVFESE
jgi:hypothetical protein